MANSPNRMFRTRLLALLVLVYPLTSYAYIDPGTGMLQWQGLMAAVGAGLVTIRRPLAAITRLLKHLRRR